jgi:PEP-CTERM motif
LKSIYSLEALTEMRRLRLAVPSLLTLLALCFCTGTALADSTVTMKLTSVGGNNAGGAYTYPYNFSIDGGKPVALICDSYDNEVVVGETWKANVTSLLSGAGLFGNKLIDYKAAGLIFKSILNGSINVNAGNFAIWGLFSQGAQNNAFFGTSGAAGIETQYLALAAKDPNSAYAGLVLYTPIAGTQSWGGTAQEYIGYSPVPEPTTLTLFGTGLISLAAMVRRKLGKA